jgi:LDH2 family malate/lactate/ureidoglycolate dehydrogenase
MAARDGCVAILTTNASPAMAPWGRRQRSGCGHLFIALDVTAFGDPDGFIERMERLVDEVKSLPLAPGFDDVFYPMR